MFAAFLGENSQNVFCEMYVSVRLITV